MNAPRRQRASAADAHELLRLPPHSIQAEQSVIGGLMIDNTAWEQVAEVLIPEDFYRRDHALIFRALTRLADQEAPFDVVTLSEALEKQGALADAGGLPYLGTLAKETPSAANIAAYAGIVREKSELRQIIAAATRMQDAAFNPAAAVDDVIEQGEREVFAVADRRARSKSGPRLARHIMPAVFDELERLFTLSADITGTPTGLADLDDITSGLQPGNLILLAARPSMGKTSLACQIAEFVAIQCRLPAMIFSMEMSSEELIKRFTASMARIPLNRVLKGRIHDDEWPRATTAAGLLSEAELIIDDTPALSTWDMRGRCRRQARTSGALGLVVVDYLQLMSGPPSDSRNDEVSAISRGLKALAKEMKVPVIALSQLNRNLESRPSKRPVPSDLRDSGALEADADLIAFIYRDEVHNKDSADKGIAEIIIAKQRNGPTGTVRLAWRGEYTRFENLAMTNDPYRGGNEW